MSKYTDYDAVADGDLTDADLFLVVDVDDVSMAVTGTNKKATLAVLRTAIGVGEARTTAVTLTGSLAADATEDLDVNLEGLLSGMLVRVQTDIEARVRLYVSEAHRTADAARAIGTDPTGDHGVVLDFVTTSGDLAWSVSPHVWLQNEDSGVTDGFIAGAVTNLSASTDTVTVTLTLVTPTGVAGATATLPEFTWRSISGAYTVVDDDCNNGLNATAAATVTIPNNLTVLGSVVIRKGGTGDVSCVAGVGVTLDKPGGRDTIATQYQTMATIPISLTHHALSGAEE